MKTNKMKAFIVIIPLLLSSCFENTKYEQAVLFDFDDFKETKELTGNIVDFDKEVLKPIGLQVYDSFLITLNMNVEKHFNIYDLQSEKCIGERIAMGQGPEEMIQPHYIKSRANKVYAFDAMSSTLFEYSLNEFVQNNKPVPEKKTKLDNELLYDVGLLENGTVASTGFDPDNQFNVFNTEGKKTLSFGNYPTIDDSYSSDEKVEMFMSHFATNSYNKIAVFYNRTDLIEFYNEKGELQKRMHGPEHFMSIFKSQNDGNAIFALPVKGHDFEAYFHPVYVNDELFVLYYGKRTDEVRSGLSNRILVFDTDGNPKRILKLDQGIFTFTVDDVNKIIYGISSSPDFHILKFSY